jgi:hypothetical protein
MEISSTKEYLLNINTEQNRNWDAHGCIEDTRLKTLQVRRILFYGT